MGQISTVSLLHLLDLKNMKTVVLSSANWNICMSCPIHCSSEQTTSSYTFVAESKLREVVVIMKLSLDMSRVV